MLDNVRGSGLSALKPAKKEDPVTIVILKLSFTSVTAVAELFDEPLLWHYPTC